MATRKKTTTRKKAPRKQTSASKQKADAVSAAVKTVARKVAEGKAASKPRAKSAKKTSALDAAVRVLGEAKGPLTTGQMIEAMSAKGYWKSPGGKTPDRTLYSAILREIATKGKDARFKKTELGQFALAKKA
jgi:hypothetical protein